MEKDKEITIKEVFERVVVLETKFEHSLEENKKTTKRFSWYVLIILLLEVANLIVQALSTHFVSLF